MNDKNNPSPPWKTGRKFPFVPAFTPRRPTALGCRLAVFLSAALVTGRVPAWATENAATNAPAASLADLSIEQLMNESVTSVAKKETKLGESAAAITVITPDEIRRLGITTIPDALRLVPGLDVAQINSHEWAVSARGFNNQFANKLLVLVDGRSVYGTGFGGVVWGVEDIPLEDLDRIEVIRGPGAALWGANAVNGVINIITKSAKETQGTLVSVSGGTFDQPATMIRYGGQLATNLYYRTYFKYYSRDGTTAPDGSDAPDYAEEFQGGGRMDWEPATANTLTLQGDYYNDTFIENQELATLLPPYSENFNEVDHNFGGNVLGRWTHEFSADSTLTFQTYYDHFRQEQAQAAETCDTMDFDIQHQFKLGERNDIVWGAGYRHMWDKFRNSYFVAWNPTEQDEELYSAFAQDEVTLLPDRVKLTLGSKLEHNDYTGLEVEPSARLLWTPTDKQTIWAAVSRAVRTPSQAELFSQANLAAVPPGILITTYGNPHLESEELIAYELGYRVELTRRSSLDLAGFYNDYDRLILPVAGIPNPYSSTDENTGPAQTYGLELSGHWNVTDWWHLTAGYSWLKMQTDIHSPLLEGSPGQQAQFRSELDLPHNLEFNGAVYYVDQFAAPYGIGQTTIPSYVRLDLGLVWRPTRNLEIGVWGQNLLDDQHVEFPSYKTSLLTEIPRGIVGRMTLRF